MWIAKKQKVADLKSRLQSAESELQIATNELGGWLCPPDTSANEKFHIWFGSGILCAQMKESLGDGSSFNVWWRKEPDGKQAIEQGV